MKYFVYEDIFAFVVRGVVSVDKADIISVQPDFDDDDLLNVFYWVSDTHGKKTVDVIREVMEFDNLEDAQVWALTDLPDFIDMVNDDKQATESRLTEIQTTLETAEDRLATAEAIVNGVPDTKKKIKKKVNK